MFNEDRKRRFIEERREEAILPIGLLENHFSNVEKLEIELNKDLCNFTVYEIKEYYKMLGKASVNSLTVLHSQFSIYTKWCLQQNLVTDNQNHFLEINRDMLNECVNKALLDMQIITRETILSWINLLENPRDQYIILALYEGINGTGCCELIKLRPEDINGNIAMLCTGRKIEISNKLVDIIDDCVSENTYITQMGKKIKLIDNGYVLKDYCNVKPEANDKQLAKRVYNSIKRTERTIDMQGILSPNVLQESGKLDMIKTRSTELGITPKEYIYSDYIKEVEKKYDCTIIDSVYYRRYKDYLD